MTWVLCTVVVEIALTVNIVVIDIKTVRKVGITFIIAPEAIISVIELIVRVFDHDNHGTETLKSVVIVMDVTIGF